MTTAKADLTLREKEQRDELYAYFDMAWAMFVRLERERKLDALHLTNPQLNPTVTPDVVQPQNQSTAPE